MALALILAIGLVSSAREALGQGLSNDTLALGIEEAVQIALERNRGLLLGELDFETSVAAAREARAGLLPQLTTDASYIRDFITLDPFAGTAATDLLDGGVPTEWLAYNEQARQDDDPDMQPISLEEFLQLQGEAYEDAGVSPDDPGTSPFTVPNQFDGGLSLIQPIFAPAATAQLRNARAMRNASEVGYRHLEITTADSVRQAFLRAQLADASVDILLRSVERTEAELNEAIRRVEEGITSVSERLAAQVQLRNLQTELIEARTQRTRAINALKVSIGLPPARPVRLTGLLEVDDNFVLADVSFEEALEVAANRRMDVDEARSIVEAQEASFEASRAARLPTVSALANLNFAGNIPDNHEQVQTDPLDPFNVGVNRRRFFHDDFWSLGASIGIQVQWNIFEGGQIRARNQQAQLAVRQAEIQLDQLQDAVRLEIDDTLNDLRAARDRALLQQETVELAERNYEVANERVLRGIVTPVERRDAAEQLDQSQLNLLQAIHDYLAARSSFFSAVGVEGVQAW